MTRKHPALTLAAVTAVLALSLAAAPQGGFAQSAPAAGSDLPGGATSLNETHGNWTVVCRVEGDQGKSVKTCAVTQQKVNDKHQRALEISLVPNAEGGAKGVILMPFGLAVTRPVRIGVDGRPMGAPLSFSTCVPLGCLVPVDLAPDEVQTMAKGVSLDLDVTSSTGQALTVSVPMQGFESAFSRTSELLK